MKTKPNETEASPFEQLAQLTKLNTELSEKIRLDVELRLLAIAADINTLPHPDTFLRHPHFTKALQTLNLAPVGTPVEPQERKPKAAKSELAPIKDTPLAGRIIEVLKKAGKPMAAQDIAVAVVKLGSDAKASTIKNYLARLCLENVLFRPQRAMFAIK